MNRFNKAVTRLYDAYYDNKLKAKNCAACAVGNICGRDSDWSFVIVTESFKTSYTQTIVSSADFDSFNDGLRNIKETGYSVEELAKVERIFLDTTICSKEGETKETQMDGLLNVVEYLASLDNIEPFKIMEEFKSNTLELC